MLSNSPALLEESFSGASGTSVVIAEGDGATDFLPAFLPAALFFAGTFFVEAVFLAVFFPLFFAALERDRTVAADFFLDALVFDVFDAFFAPFLPAFLATISISLL